MKRNYVDAFSLWSSHRFSSQYHGCLTLWYVNNGWCSVNGKTTKKNKRVLFCSPQCVAVSQDKAHLLERRSLFKVCVYLCGCGCVCVSLCVCWTTELLLSPLLADRSLTLFSIVRRPQRDGVIKELIRETQRSGFFFSATLRPKGTIRRSRLDFLFPHFTDTKKKITYLHLHLVFSLILPVPQSFLF